MDHYLSWMLWQYILTRDDRAFLRRLRISPE